MDLFKVDSEGTADDKIDAQKKKYEEYISALGDYEALYDMEVANIHKGYYRQPFTAGMGHREINPAWAQMKAQEFFNSTKESSKSGNDDKQDIFISGMYPKYYMDAQHFESGRWLSSKKASSYEFAMETLNTGARDTIQRLTLIPIFFSLKDNRKHWVNMKVLDVGGGTGRFMTFFRDNYPHMEATLLDLNPFFLQEAGKNDRYFRKFFHRQDTRTKTEKVEPSELKLVQGKAEDMADFEDGTFDILTCINLFTAMPSEARRQAAKEFFRVLVPGGILSFNDAVQKHDRAGKVLDLITDRYNEELLASYQTEDLNQIFFEAGFKPGPTSPIIAASSKVMSWIKPLEDEGPEAIKEVQKKSLELFKTEMVADEEDESRPQDVNDNQSSANDADIDKNYDV